MTRWNTCIGEKKKRRKKKKGILKNDDIDQPGFIDLPFIFHKKPSGSIEFFIAKRLQSPFRYGFYGLRMYYFHGLLKSHVGYT